MSADSIQIKLKDRSDSRGNTFDGVTLNFAPSICLLISLVILSTDLIS